jgi:hypothetical protein
MLICWGQFAQEIGWIDRMRAVPVPQRTRDHSPQSKLIELQAAILCGQAHLQDISRGAHPLVQDKCVAHAWGQAAWADYSGISRTLKACTAETVAALCQVCAAVSRPFLDREVLRAMQKHGYLLYDGDLTGRPVSSTSKSYPGAAFGWMDDGVRLGYQAALVSMESPTYGRLWLSVKQQPGDTVSSSQVEAMVQAAETSTQVRPRRRTELLAQRMAEQDVLLEEGRREEGQAEERLRRAEQRLAEVHEEQQRLRHDLMQLELVDQARERPQRPHSRLSQTRAKLAVREKRLGTRQRDVAKVGCWLERCQGKVRSLDAELGQLRERLKQFEEDNASNHNPVRVIFRLDAGFGSSANIALLIELGYDVYTKANNGQLVHALRSRAAADGSWTRVGKNAEMVTWARTMVASCPYPLDVGLERFLKGDRREYAVLLHYGVDHTAANPKAWFRFYNGRQIVEAGIKEGKSVLQMRHLKVRSAAGLAIQEQMTVFAANFIRWAAEWLQEHSVTTSSALRRAQSNVKQLVQVAANTSAWVVWQPQGCLLRFKDHSAFAGTEIMIGHGRAFQFALPLYRSRVSEPFSAISTLIAQPLG